MARLHAAAITIHAARHLVLYREHEYEAVGAEMSANSLYWAPVEAYYRVTSPRTGESERIDAVTQPRPFSTALESEVRARCHVRARATFFSVCILTSLGGQLF